MGMFDSVFVTCPNCGTVLEFQSKAGVCDLKRYKHTSVPAAVAADLHGEITRCKGCDSEVKLQSASPERVPMTIEAIEDWD